MQLPECYASAVSLFNGMVRADKVFYTMSDQLVVRYEELRRGIPHSFSLPIPQVVCERMKVFQNDVLVQFIEECWSWKQGANVFSRVKLQHRGSC